MLEQKQYVPLLKTGVAEVGAYRSLFPGVKDATFPIFQVRPWPNAGHLSLTVDRLRDAMHDHPFGLALDYERRGHASTRPAQGEFESLFEPHRGFAAYFEFLTAVPNAVPVILPTSSVDVLIHQLANADELNRGLIVHQRRGSELPLSDTILRLFPFQHNAIFVVDAGWSRDYLSLEAWTLSAVERLMRALPDSEIVVCSSSFPSSFSHIIGNVEELGTERRLFSVVRQRFNQADLTYGDWASTRPQQGGGGGTIPSRVDLPKLSSWEIFRSDPDADLGFHEMAWQASHHPCFAPTPDCWGKEMIGVTNDEGVGITGRQVATEVRLNIHMTIQSGAFSMPPLDEIPYED